MASQKRQKINPAEKLLTKTSGTSVVSFDVSGGIDDSVEPSAQSDSTGAPFSGTTGPSAMSQATIGPALPSTSTTGSIGRAMPSTSTTAPIGPVMQPMMGSYQLTDREKREIEEAQEFVQKLERDISGSGGSLSSGVSYTSIPTSISTTTSTLMPSSTSMTASTTTSTSTTATQDISFSAAEDYKLRDKALKWYPRSWEFGADRQTYTKIKGLNIGVFGKTSFTPSERGWMETVADFWAAGVTSTDGTPIESTHALLLDGLHRDGGDSSAPDYLHAVFFNANKYVAGAHIYPKS